MEASDNGELSFAPVIKKKGGEGMGGMTYILSDLNCVIYG